MLASAFLAATRINRKDFGVSFNQTLDQGGLALGEEVAIAIERLHPRLPRFEFEDVCKII